MSSRFVEFLCNGDGTLRPPVIFAMPGTDLVSLVAADFTRYGNPDVAVVFDCASPWQNGLVTALLCDGRGSFQTSASSTIHASPQIIVAAGFNNVTFLIWPFRHLAVAAMGLSASSLGTGTAHFK